MSRPTQPARPAQVGLDEIVEAIAHSIRNPLAGAVLRLETLRQGAEPGSDERDACDSALESLGRIARCIDGLVELTHPPSATPRALSMGAFFGAHRARWRASVERRGRALRITEPDPGLVAYADDALLNASVDRLLDNAVEATAFDATITIAAFADEHGIALKITNPGDLRDCDRSAAATPFRPAKARGLGIGLAIVRNALRSMGGALELRGSDAGTTATLRLRAPSAEAAR